MELTYQYLREFSKSFPGYNLTEKETSFFESQKSILKGKGFSIDSFLLLRYHMSSYPELYPSVPRNHRGFVGLIEAAEYIASLVLVPDGARKTLIVGASCRTNEMSPDNVFRRAPIAIEEIAVIKEARGLSMPDSIAEFCRQARLYNSERFRDIFTHFYGFLFDRYAHWLVKQEEVCDLGEYDSRASPVPGLISSVA